MLNNSSVNHFWKRIGGLGKRKVPVRSLQYYKKVLKTKLIQQNKMLFSHIPVGIDQFELVNRKSTKHMTPVSF